MVSRRFFLKSSGLALVGFGAVPQALVRSVYAAEAGRRKKTLVVVFQRGAMDGLNVVAPYADPVYRKLRPTIGLPAPNGNSREAVLDLDRYFGLHPARTGKPVACVRRTLGRRPLAPPVPRRGQKKVRPIHGGPGTARTFLKETEARGLEPRSKAAKDQASTSVVRNLISGSPAYGRVR